MERSKLTEEQVAYALRQAESGTLVADVCRQLGVSEATFYIWKKKYVHLGVSELLRDECLNVQQFSAMADAKAKIEAWQIHYNQHRPHGSFGHLTPMEYASQRQDERTVEAA